MKSYGLREFVIITGGLLVCLVFVVGGLLMLVAPLWLVRRPFMRYLPLTEEDIQKRGKRIETRVAGAFLAAMGMYMFIPAFMGLLTMLGLVGEP